MASSRKTLSPAMRSRSLARLETTPVIENAPINRPQPARMPTSSTKVRPLTSRKARYLASPQRFLPRISFSTTRLSRPPSAGNSSAFIQASNAPPAPAGCAIALA